MQRWLRLLGGFATLLTLAIPSSAAPKASGPQLAVRAFYRSHFRHNMQFDGRELARHRSALTPELYRLLRYAWTRPSPKDEPPYFEGDAFTDSQETPSSYHVGTPRRARGGSSVPVTFTWKDRGRVVERKHDSVLVKRIGGRYLIDDIRTQDGRSLVAELRELRQKDASGRRQRR